MNRIHHDTRNGVSLGVRVRDGLRRAHRRRVAMRELGRLDSRLLADIGISREDIPAVVDAMVARGRVHAAEVVSPSAGEHRIGAAADCRAG